MWQYNGKANFFYAMEQNNKPSPQIKSNKTFYIQSCNLHVLGDSNENKKSTRNLQKVQTIENLESKIKTCLNYYAVGIIRSQKNSSITILHSFSMFDFLCIHGQSYLHVLVAFSSSQKPRNKTWLKSGQFGFHQLNCQEMLQVFANIIDDQMSKTY